MNTFEEVEKIKWIIEIVKKPLIKKGIVVKYASLLFENGEDNEIYEEIKSRAEFNKFENLPLFISTFENNDLIKLKLIIFIFEDFNAAEVLINGESHGQNFNDDINLRKVIPQIHNHLTRGDIGKIIKF